MFSFPPCCRTQDTSLYSNMQDPISLESGERMGITKGTLTWMEQGRTTPSAPGVTASPRKALQEIYREILHKNTAASPGDHTQEVQSKERGRNASCPCSCRLHRAQVLWSKFAPRAASFSPPLFLHDATGIILLVKRCTSSLELLLLENSISCPGNAAQWSTGAWISPEFKAVQKTHRNPGLSSENHLFFCLQLNLLVTGRRDVMGMCFMVCREFYNIKNNKKIDLQNCLPPKQSKWVTPPFYHWFSIYIKILFKRCS